MITFDYTLVTVALGGAMVGLLSGVLGTFALLRRQSLLGDTISHAALPGIALAFLATGLKDPLVLLVGAMAAGWVGTLVISAVVRRSRVRLDAGMAVVLAGFFGLGLALLSVIQNLPNANQAGLSKFLFGNASTMLRQDVVVMAVFVVLSLAVVTLLWKEFKVSTFDPDFARSLGYPLGFLDTLLLSLVVVAITIGLQSVGVVLMSAMLVAPAAAARQWTDRLGTMVVLAALFGVSATVTGALVSSAVPRLPTGPTTVVLISAVVLVSLTLAPRRGLAWAALRRLRDRGEVAQLRLLEELYWLAQNHPAMGHLHEPGALKSVVAGSLKANLAALGRNGWIETLPGGVRLTNSGLEKAQEALVLGRTE